MKDERTMQTEEHFLRSLGNTVQGKVPGAFRAHIKLSESLELAPLIPTHFLRRPSYLIYPLLFSLPKTGVFEGCRCCPLHASEFC